MLVKLIDAINCHDISALRLACLDPFAVTPITLNTSYRELSGKTPLTYAISQKSSKDICALLIKRGADVNLKDQNDKSALHYAVEMENMEVINLLLTTDNINVDTSDLQRKTPLHRAILQKNIHIVDTLLTKGSDISLTDNLDRTPLYYAVDVDYPEIFHLLLRHGANARHEGLLQNTVYNNSPLCAAISNDNPKILNHLLDKGFSIDKNLLLIAVTLKAKKCCTALIDREYDINFVTPHYNQSLLYKCTGEKSKPIYDLLISRGINPYLTDRKKNQYFWAKKQKTYTSEENDTLVLQDLFLQGSERFWAYPVYLRHKIYMENYKGIKEIFPTAQKFTFFLSKHPNQNIYIKNLTPNDIDKLTDYFTKELVKITNHDTDHVIIHNDSSANSIDMIDEENPDNQSDAINALLQLKTSAEDSPTDIAQILLDLKSSAPIPTATHNTAHPNLAGMVEALVQDRIFNIIDSFLDSEDHIKLTGLVTNNAAAESSN